MPGRGRLDVGRPVLGPCFFWFLLTCIFLSFFFFFGGGGDFLLFFGVCCVFFCFVFLGGCFCVFLEVVFGFFWVWFSWVLLFSAFLKSLLGIMVLIDLFKASGRQIPVQGPLFCGFLGVSKVFFETFLQVSNVFYGIFDRSSGVLTFSIILFLGFPGGF